LSLHTITSIDLLIDNGIITILLENVNKKLAINF
jgi:hypothetical protein